MAKIGTTFSVYRAHQLLARGILTHRHQLMGDLVQIYCAGRTDEWHGTPDVTVFFPLGAAIRQGLVEKTGVIAVPPHLAEFPVFRSAHHDPATGAVGSWWCWDGAREWQYDGPSEDIAHLPYWEAVNDTALLELLAERC